MTQSGTDEERIKNEQEAFEERAAIMEYCGGLSRTEAEKQAKACLSTETEPPKEDKRSPEAREALTKARQILNGN